MIVTHELTKRFGTITAVDELELRVPAGCRFGLLGPNGSGKTTLVRMLLGLVHPTRGSVELLGQPMPARAAEVLPRVGALVESPAAWPQLSGPANLRLLDAAGGSRRDNTAGGSRRDHTAGGAGPSGSFAERLSGAARRDRARRVARALDLVGLGGIDRRPVRAYSLGMRQRLGIAAALLREPELLLLDEPTNGLDPRGINEIRELLVTLNEAGTTVVLSSHLLAEVEQLCTRIGVMDAGRLVLAEDLATLRAPTGRVLVRTPDPAAVAALLDGQVARRDGDVLEVRSLNPAELNARLVRAGIRVTELVPQRRNLEQLVLELTGPGADRMERSP